MNAVQGPFSLRISMCKTLAIGRELNVAVFVTREENP
jgi:hypothetical protein